MVDNILEKPENKTEVFYQRLLGVLIKTKIPFLIGGTFAVQKYLHFRRKTGDLDIFCKPSDAIKLIKNLSDNGYKVELSDARWLAKIYQGTFIVDIIFATHQGIVTVDESWFKKPRWSILFGHKIRLVPLEELIWSKSFRQDRYRYDGPDINHLILRLGQSLNWAKLLDRMDPYWEILFAHIINFRFIYPSERDIVPQWLMDELIKRLQLQLKTPKSLEKVCRGPILAKDPYQIDLLEWGFEGIM